MPSQMTSSMLPGIHQTEPIAIANPKSDSRMISLQFKSIVFRFCSRQFKKLGPNILMSLTDRAKIDGSSKYKFSIQMLQTKAECVNPNFSIQLSGLNHYFTAHVSSTGTQTHALTT